MSVVLFDFDGTLADSTAIITATFAQVAREELGIDQPDEAYLPFVGPPLSETFSYLGKTDDPERVNELIAAYRRIYFETMYATPLFDGVEPMLAALAEAGVPMLIATSKRTDAASKLMGHLGILHYFARVCGSPEGSNHGTKADRVAEALAFADERGWGRAEAVMVGDRIHDVEGARANGIPTILVGWGPTPEEEYKEADLVAPTPRELTEILLQWPAALSGQH